MVLARAAVVLLAALALLAAAALAQPAAYNLDQQPSWYSAYAQGVPAGAVRVWMSAPSTVTATYTGVDSFENSFILYSGSASTSYSGTWYSNPTFSYGFATDRARTGSYSYKMQISGTLASTGVGTATVRLTLTGSSAGGTASIYYYRAASGSGQLSYYTYSLIVRVNGNTVANIAPGLNAWTQVSFTLPAGSVTITVEFTITGQAASGSTYSFTETLWLDDAQLFPQAQLPLTATANATHTLIVVQNPYTVTLQISQFTASATLNGATYTDTFPSSSIPPGGTTFAVKAVVAPWSGGSFAYSGLQAVARAPSGTAVLFATGPTGTQAWRDLVYSPAASGTVSATLTSAFITVDTPVNVTLRSTYPDATGDTVNLSAGRNLVAYSRMPAWLNFSSTDGWLKVVTPQQGEELRIAAPASGAVPVTFYINDYGQGYTHLVVYMPASRLAWRDEISAATKSAVAYLQPYGSYILALRKPGEERVLGPVTVSQTQYTLTVLPQLQPAPPPSTAVVWYNSSLPGYVVDVSCSSPPCTITLVKKQATQPLAAEFTVPSGGATIAPHLFVWSFDGVDDYVVVEALAPPASSSLSLVTRALLLNPVTSVNQYFISKYERMALRGYMGGLANLGAIWRYSDGTGGELNTGRDIRGAWHHLAVVYASSTGTISIFLDGTEVDRRAASMPLKEGGYYYIGAWHVTCCYIPAYISEAIVFSRAVSGSELQAMMNYVVNATGLLFFLDPTWFNGTHYVSLTGGYVGKGYNGVARLPANRTWLWVVQGFPGDGKLHFRFFPEGSRATVWCGSTIIGVQLGWGDVAVQVPAGESCRVAVHVAPQPYVLETASYTCSEARCRFTWITDDPFLEARVEDASGTTYVVFSGTSLPQRPGGLPGLADLVNWLAGRTGLDYLVGPGAVQAFLVALGSVLLLIAFSTAGSWEFGLLAAAAGLVLLPILLGAPPLAVPAGLVIALAALSLMLRKEREE